MNDPRTESAELKLERLITGVVAGLPQRPAPAALERRVLAAIPDGDAHLGRAQGFAAWPMPARWLAMPALTVFSVALLIVSGNAERDATDLVRALVPGGLTALWEALRATWEATGGAVALLGRSVPGSWWYGALAAFACWYAGVVGLGLTAYRLLRTRE